MGLNNINEFFGIQYETHSLRIVRFIFIGVLIALFMYFIQQRWKLVSTIKKLPLMKWKFYHFLGDSHHAIRTRKMKTHLSHNIYDFLILEAYSILFQRESIFAIWATWWPMVVAHKADAVEALLNNSANLKKAWIYKYIQPWLGDSILISHGTKWKHRRKLLTPSFHFNILKNFLPVINKQTRIFVDILNNHTSEESIDITPLVTRCSFDIMCESILGSELHTQREPNNPYAKSVSILTKTSAERVLNPLLWPYFIFKNVPVGKMFFENITIAHDFANNIIRERREQLLNAKTSIEKEEVSMHKRKAFLDLLLDEHIENNSISLEEIRQEVDTFAFAGHDTTSTALSWSLYLIGLHPQIQGKIRQELDSIFGWDDRDVNMDDLRDMKYLECVLKECMRLYPPIPFLARDLEQDIEFQNYIIPAGCPVFINIYTLHRDPDVFPNPEKFDPDRFSPENSINRNAFAYIPFSAGPRNCIGQRFAFMELKTIISLILRKFKLLSLDPRDKIHVLPEVVLRPAESLRLEIRPRNQTS